MRHLALLAALLPLLAPLAVLPAAQAARPSAVTALSGAAATKQPATAPEPPQFPESYTVRYMFSLPYTAKLQPDGIRYPVVFYRDATSRSTRTDTYNSTTVLIVNSEGTKYELVPRIDRQVCLVMGGGDEPTRSGAAAPGTLNALQLMSALPDVRGWDYQGNGILGNGMPTRVWQYTARHAAKTVIYRLDVSAEDPAVPLRLHMQGNDMFSGAHFDEYVVEYEEYLPGRPDPKVFDKPGLCEGVEPQAAPAGRLTASQMRMAAVVPTVAYRGGHAQYDAFLSTHGSARQHSSLEDYHTRAAVFEANHALIQAHNKRNAGYNLAMNKFGDYTEEEFIALMLPRRARRMREGQAGASQQQPANRDGPVVEADGAEGSSVGHSKLGRHELPHEPLTNSASLPAEISWRGTAADGLGPMDQATCGSCWAFSAAGAMEGAWQRATGQRASFSEQQIVDCSWGWVPGDPGSNLGCDGGNHWAAIGYVVDAGGIALTADYQYKGQDGYCMTNTTKLTGKFKGYARVPKYDDDALREALYSRGPIAISFDAGQPAFRFYSSGVYRDEQCQYKEDLLDHDILLVGYGSSPEGDYWEVKNSWSDHWGDGGYFKVAVDNHACGVTTDAVYAVVADSA